jgi:NADH-quinone oxidoreductase subunit J
MGELIQNVFSGQILLFLIFGFGAVVSAITMVLYPNPIRSALFLVLNLFCVAVLYLLLNAYFLAVVQVIVYAGAIMVLFLFVIMLLNLGTPDRQADRLKWQQSVALVGGIALAILLGVAIAVPTPPAPGAVAASRPRAVALADAGALTPAGGAPVTESSATGGTTRVTPGEAAEAPVVPAVEPYTGTTEGVGRELYDPNKPYLFPFEVTSILLLIAVIGSVVLAKRRMPGENLASSRVDTVETI